MQPPKRPPRPTRRHFWHEEHTTAPSNRIWEIWTDVANWHHWDRGLRSARLSGTFTAGARGELTALNGQTTPFELCTVVPGRTYTFGTKLPFGGLYVLRKLYPTETGTTFTHEVWFAGRSSGIFALLLGKKFQRLLPEAMRAITKIAEGS